MTIVGGGYMMDSGYWIGSVIGLILHETGHVCVARRLGLRIKRIGMSWRGPFIVRETGSPNANAIVSAAGPWVNLVLALSFWHDWHSFAIANLVLGLSNLVPTRNSDGSRIWRELSLTGKFRWLGVPAASSAADHAN
jgi:Zn-dependent protease